MPETTTKTSAKTKAVTEYRGKRVIVWNPENSYRQSGVAALRGYEMVRKYAFIWEDEAASELVKQSGQPAFKDLILEPGLNWIDAAHWAEAITASAYRNDGFDEITKLIESKAILVFEPGERVTKTGQFTGNFEDYAPQELKRLMNQVDDIGALQDYAKRTQDFALTQVIQERIDALDRGY